MSGNEPGSSLTHAVGAVLAIAGLTLLVVFAALTADPWRIVSVAIFGSAMVLLYIASSLYHLFARETRAKEVFKRLDHSMIFVLIAGTYTPVCLVLLRGWTGWTLFGFVWGLAILGIAVKSVGMRVRKSTSTMIYILLGWSALAAAVPLRRVLTVNGWLWLLLGGVLYTAGAYFYAKDRIWQWTKWFGAHELWHLFVMGGSFSHFWFVLRYVI